VSALEIFSSQCYSRKISSAIPSTVSAAVSGTGGRDDPGDCQV
jgi:hypothetical protein